MTASAHKQSRGNDTGHLLQRPHVCYSDLHLENCFMYTIIVSLIPFTQQHIPAAVPFPFLFTNIHMYRSTQFISISIYISRPYNPIQPTRLQMSGSIKLLPELYGYPVYSFYLFDYNFSWAEINQWYW